MSNNLYFIIFLERVAKYYIEIFYISDLTTLLQDSSFSLVRHVVLSMFLKEKTPHFYVVFAEIAPLNIHLSTDTGRPLLPDKGIKNGL